MKTSLLAVIAFAGLCHASSIFSTGATTSGGVNVNASAVFTPGTNSLNIQFLNNIIDPVTVGQNISGIDFTLSNGNQVLSAIAAQPVTSFAGSGIDISSSGIPSAVPITLAAIQSNWLGSYLGNTHQLQFTAIGSNFPNYTVIGGDGSNGIYDGANGSLTATQSHPPYLNSGASFTLALNGVLPTTTVSNVKFLFGTAPSSALSTLNTVPEPATMGLIGIGLLAAGIFHRKQNPR